MNAKAAVRKRKKKKGGNLSLLGLFALVAAIVFMPTTIVLFFGMLPTIVAALIDRTGKGTKAITVGAMNLAGCTLFLLDLWTGGHTTDRALMLISDPRTIITIYSAAGAGYMIDWMMGGVVTTIMIHRSTARIKEIKKRQSDLAARWGREVTGELELDAAGFPLAAEHHDEGKD